jgi:hypothetical protein
MQKTFAWRLRAVVAILSFVAAGQTVASPSVIQPGLKQWVNAAQTSRADMWLLGDSIAGPFDAGLINDVSSRFGLAGTGVGSEYLTDNRHAQLSPGYPLNSNGWDNTIGAVSANRQDYVLSSGEPTTSGPTPTNYSYSFTIDPSSHLNPQGAIDWHVWTASPAGGGSMQAELLPPGAAPVLQLTPAVTTQTPANGLQHTVFHFDPTTGHDGQTLQGTLINTSNTSVLYTRLLKPGGTGATVTTWGYGGHDALQFYHDKYLGGPTSQAGRVSYLNALTDGGSGKLMVVLEEGTNDGGETNPSVHGITPGSSPAAFLDNMTTLIDGIKGDWAATGKNADDLSFLVLGMYQYGHRDDATQALHRSYAQELADLSMRRSDVSFVDLYDIAPTWDQANALGYMVDDVHPTVLGATVYSAGIFDQVVSATVAPEPGSVIVMVLGLSGAILSRHRDTRKPRR